ncbi:MAG: MCE family protein [Nitrospira sp.]|nr:MAG: MCE family protein [Nitrospira sp.]
MIDRQGPLTLAQVKVGLLIVTAIGILVFMVINLEEGMGLFVRHATYHVRVENTLGLKIGGPVRLNGVDIGNIRNIAIAEAAPMVDLTFTIQRQLAPYIRDDASVSINALGLLGDKFLEIHPGSASNPPLAIGGTFAGHAVGTDLGNITTTAGETLERMNQALREIQKVLIRLNDGQGTAGKVLSDSTLYDRSTQVLGKLEAAADKGIGILSKVERGDGTIGLLLSDAELYTRANRAVKDLNDLSARLANKNGTLTKLSDPELYQRIETLTKRGEALLGKVERGEGTVGKLVTNDDLYQRADKLLTEVETLVAEVKKNPTKFFKFSMF